ncbi:MAG: TatD family hydrolase [Atopobiaceae bacterium]
MSDGEAEPLVACGLADAHVHLGFMSNAAQVAGDAQAAGLGLFANTVTPQEYLALRAEPWTQLSNVRLGVGLHPWWVADGRASQADAQLVARLVPQTAWVGEVGLDFSPKHTDPASHDAQVLALRTVLEACASAPLPPNSQAGATQGAATRVRTISLHSVASAGTVLDLLESTGALDRCRCVFHWFSGSTPDLWRAIRSGCWFSVNPRQARTRRAKEQLKLIPTDRLLLETDFPPGEGVTGSAAQIADALAQTCELTARIRGVEPDELHDAIAANSQALPSV